MGKASRRKREGIEASRQAKNAADRAIALVAEHRTSMRDACTAILELASQVKRGDPPSDSDLDIIIDHATSAIALLDRREAQ